jgi:hypothetical protein
MKKQVENVINVIKNNQKKYIIYSISNYSLATQEFINNNQIIFTSKTKLCKELFNDNNYHFRVHKNEQYIFFGDIDNYTKGIDNFIDILISFVKDNYSLELSYDDILYTENNYKKGSYHYSIPKWNLSCENLKKIHSHLLTKYNNEFVINNKYCIDTTIYSEHFYRCPHQSKGKSNDKGIHIIKKGTMIDFIINHIPTDSKDINDYLTKYDYDISKKYVNKKKIKLENNDENIINSNNEFLNLKDLVVPAEQLNPSDLVLEQKTSSFVEQSLQLSKNNKINYNNKEVILTSVLHEPDFYKKIFDECYHQKRFEEYSYWIHIGMAIYNIFGESDLAFQLYDYYSSKGSNYNGYEASKIKYLSFTRKENKTGFTVATIYYYAKQDNEPKFIEIMNKNTFELGPTDLAQYIKLLASHKFIYLKEDNKYTLFCFNDKYWEKNDILLKKYINTELYEFLKFILINVYWNSKEFNLLKKNIEKLKNMSIKKEIIETYKEYGDRDDIKFDDKWWLLGFNNVVYDMKEQQFRNYNYDDYITTTTGYDWREPTEEELTTVNHLINLIFPHEDEKELYLQILSTGLDGRCLEKFIIAQGNGGNGKGLLHDLLLLGLGNYALLGNNSILFEAARTGSNPEKANLHKKRLVIFREPTSTKKFENNIIKELTGGGLFSCRNHYESNTQKELNLTMIVECNQKPLLSEEPSDADIRRIIDINFKSKFTTDDNILDDINYIYKADLTYKTSEWQHKHKFALIKILLDKHKNYTNNNFIFKIPKTIQERTNQYLVKLLHGLKKISFSLIIKKTS